MKKRIVFSSFFFILTVVAQAQQQKEVSLIVTGEGATKEAATNNALRSAIEQALDEQNVPSPERVTWNGYPDRLMRAVGDIKKISQGKLQLALVPMDYPDPIVLMGDDIMWNDYGTPYPAEFSFYGSPHDPETFRSCFPVTKTFKEGELIYNYRVRIPFSQEKIAKIKSIAVKDK